MVDKVYYETEPNNTEAAANQVGQLVPGDTIIIHAHVNGQTDPADYFAYTTTAPGTVHEQTISAQKGVIYDNTYTTQGDKPQSIWVNATGNIELTRSKSVTGPAHRS
jgi:hypothetical protein